MRARAGRALARAARSDGDAMGGPHLELVSDARDDAALSLLFGGSRSSLSSPAISAASHVGFPSTLSVCACTCGVAALSSNSPRNATISCELSTA